MIDLSKAAILSRRVSESCVYHVGDLVYKTQPKVMTDTEFYCLTALSDSGYVPSMVEQLDVELIVMEYVRSESITDPERFMSHLDSVLYALAAANIRHGDLTEYAVLVRNNSPVIIDFGEARWRFSPFPSKRPDGDRFWLEKTMRKMAHDATSSSSG